MAGSARKLFSDIAKIRRFGVAFYVFLAVNVVLFFAGLSAQGGELLLILLLLFIFNFFIVLSKIAQFESFVAVRAGTPVEAQAIVEAMHLPAFLYNDDLAILVFNKAAESFFSLSQGEVIGQEFTPETFKMRKFALLSAVMLPSFSEGKIAVIREDEHIQVQHLFLKTPPVILEIATSRLQRRRGDVVNLKIIRDVTRETRIESAAEDTLNAIAHQLRTPVSEIKWFLESINKEHMTQDDKDILLQMQARIQFLMDSVNTILESAKAAAGVQLSLQRDDIGKIIEELLPIFKADLASRGVKLSFIEPAKDIAPFVFDKKKVSMALFNLLDNAIRYSTNGGEVSCMLLKQENRPYIDIVVKDQGIGIDEADKARLFSKFFRAKNAIEKGEVEGTGLGLYLSKKIIEAHGGTISVESALGKGSVFTVTLPTDEALIPKN